MSRYESKVPISETKAPPIAALGHSGGCKIVHSNSVEQLATNFFDTSKKGITVGHIVAQFGVNKQHARRSIKRCLANHVLFAPENHKPQRYYPVSRRPQVIEFIHNKKRLPIQATGTSHVSSHHPLFHVIEGQKANNFLDMLRLLPLCPRHIHNLHMKTKLDKSYYGDIDTVTGNRTKGKSITERIGLRQVTYTYYPAGSITMEVKSSYNPFRIACEDDVNILFGFIGQIKDRMTIHLNDPRERIVPDFNVWTLNECDVNVDIELTDLGQVTLQDIQISTMGRVFRAYVKILESKAVYRLEETQAVDSPLLEAFDSIAHPNRTLENLVKAMNYKVDALQHLIDSHQREYISKALSEGFTSPEGGIGL